MIRYHNDIYMYVLATISDSVNMTGRYVFIHHKPHMVDVPTHNGIFSIRLYGGICSVV